MGINLVQVRLVVQTMSEESWTTAKTTRRTAETTTATRERWWRRVREIEVVESLGSLSRLGHFGPTPLPICFLLPSTAQIPLLLLAATTDLYKQY
jgi:hypothetical protein